MQLSEAERVALAEPGLKSRARAIDTLNKTALRLGMAPDVHAQLVATLRERGAGEAKDARRLFEKLEALLDNYGVDAVEIVDEQPDEEQVETEETSEEAAEPDEMRFSFRKVQHFFGVIDMQTKKRWVQRPDAVADASADDLVAMLDLYALNTPSGKTRSKRVMGDLIATLSVGERDDESAEKRREKAAREIAGVLDGLKKYQVTVEQAVAETPSVLAQASFEEVEHLIVDLSNGYDPQRVEVFLEKLQEVGALATITVEDFSHEAMAQIAHYYKDNSKLSLAAINQNIFCTWGYLARVDSDELLHACKGENPEATLGSVTKAKKQFCEELLSLVAGGAELAVTLTEEDEEGEEEGAVEVLPEIITGTSDDGGEEAAGALEPEAEEEPAETDTQEAASQLEPEPSQPEPERPDDRPQHLRIADAYVDKFPGIEAVNGRRAFEELLNPAGEPDMSPMKKIVMEQLRSIVSQASLHGEIINRLEVPAEAKAAVRFFVGLGFKRNNHPEERPPVSLARQLIMVDKSKQPARVAAFYQGLEALLEALSAEGDPEVAKKPAVLQVQFNDGGIALR